MAAGKGEPAAAQLPQVPAWVQVTLVGAVAATWHLTAWVAQQLYPGDTPRDYILAAIPTYFLLMAVERFLLALYAKGTAPARYDAVDTWASITSGLVQQLVSRAFSACVGKFLLPYLTYTYLWRNFALTHPDPKAWTTTALCLLATDFCYYWMHRYGHTNALLWAGHQYHHNSEHFNFSTALRQSWWQSFFSPLYHLPCAFFLPPSVYFPCTSINVVYQFWVHTCLVRRLGPLEWFLSTPSHHRIHHDRRVHKNFGGMFIVWDRLFGTFLDEEENFRQLAAQEPSTTAASDTAEPHTGELELFGIMRPVQSWIEPALQLDGFRAVLQRLASRPASQWWAALMAGPGQTTATKPRLLRMLPAHGPGRRFRIDATQTPLGGLYFAVNSLVLLGLGAVLLLLRLPALPLAGGCLFVVASLALQGALLDGQVGAVPMEAARCGLVLASVAVDVTGLAQMGSAGALLSPALMATSALGLALALLVPAALPGRLVRHE